MFKVVEKEDGSTVVLCGRTNKVLLVLKNSSPSRIYPMAVGQPIPQAKPAAVSSTSLGLKKPSACVLPSPRRLTEAPALQKSLSIQSESPALKITTKREIFPTYEPEFRDVDYSDDCITSEQFFQVLNLVPKRKIPSSGISDEQKTKFPLRHISKRSEKLEFTAPPLAKVYEEVDIFSPLGKRWLYEGQTKSRNIISPSSAKECCKKYGVYCRVSLSNVGSKDYDIPKLRCRDAKAYPETFRPQKNKKGGCHMYSFTKRERLERLRIIETGLNSRSRKLKRLLKPFSIKLARLNPEVVKEWTRKKPCVITNSELPNLEISVNDVATGSSSTHTEFCLDSKKSNDDLKQDQKLTKMSPKCKLKDVKKSIVCRNGAFYVRGTSVCVTNFKEAAKGMPKPGSGFCDDNIQEGPAPKIVIKFPSHDHPYHRVIDPVVVSAVKKVPSNVIMRNNSNRCNIPIVSSDIVSPRPVNPSSLQHSPIPVIDLVDDDDGDDDDEIRVMVPHQVIGSSFFSTFIFICFGCHFKKTFDNGEEANKVIMTHMRGYHSVFKTHSFIECNPDYGKNVLFIEAFPGYKTGNKTNL